MNRRRTQQDPRTGATLLVILALVTILSILVLAYLGTVQFERTATQNYSGELTADQIARGGLDRQVADLDEEIKAGSTALPGSVTTAPVYYKPVSTLSMVPARYNGTGYDYTNVVRVSSSNNTYYAAAFPKAVYPGQISTNLAVGSATTSKNPDGRFISGIRWQMPQLLLPSETNAAVMPVPDWILVTRSGPTNAAGIAFGSTGDTLNNRTSSNPNFVVGRYAYIVYNEGGLLDATVAGASAPGADNLGNRGSLALAALTNSVLTPAQMTALAGWRNRSTGAATATYTNYVYGTGTTNGFLQVQPGDNTFLSRQDLISYASYAGITSALPYLGTFNRAVNAPAYTPGTTSTENPDILTLRYARGGTVNADGTLLKARTVKEGDFLLSRRFPLSRLAWVGYNGPANGASAYDVWRAFGLVWDSTNNAWTYVSGIGASVPTATAIQTSIRSLASVASEATVREPDFFELLQAGILKGSLGQTSGPQYSFTSGTINLYGGSGDTSGYDSVPAYHLIQIGANIIDQARADSFPTAIRFGPDSRDSFVDEDTGTPNSTYVEPRTFYGVKNLPYISRIIDTYVRWVTPPSPLSNSDRLPSNAFPGKVYYQPYVGCWQQVELWNPHQTTSTVPSRATGLYPSAVRIAASGKIHGLVYSRQNTGSATGSNYTANSYRPGTRPPSNQPALTTWNYTTDYMELSSTGIQNFSEPKLIFTNDLSSAAANCIQPGNLTTGTGTRGANGASFAGLYVGSAYAPDWYYCASNTVPTGGTGKWPPSIPPTTDTTFDQACVSYNLGRINAYKNAAQNSFGTSYEMQYLDPSGVWRPYGVVKNQTLTADSVLPFATNSTLAAWTLGNTASKLRFSQGIDPRTDRFSMSKGRSGDTAVNEVAQTRINDTIRSDTGKGHSSDGCIPWGATTWFGNTTNSAPPLPPTRLQALYYLGGIMENTESSSTYYKDWDGVLRRGDAAYNSVTSDDGHPGIQNAFFSSSVNLARPVFLNRPFRSVGELGYVGRDIPWKTLDFFTKESGDAGLLELFSVSDAEVVAGTIDLNTRNAAALAEVLGGGAVNPLHTSDAIASPITPALARTLAEALISATKTKPLPSRAGMITSALDATTGETVLTTKGFTAQSAKIQREAAIRPLSESGNARTWNLLIDIIAQSGRYPQTLTPGASYDSFIPEGEKRYWLHVAIDRYTGKVVDRFLEPVQE